MSPLKMFKVNLVGWLIILAIAVIVRSLIAVFIERCAHQSAEYKGYTESVDKSIMKNISSLSYFFTILMGSVVGAMTTFIYVCSLSKKGNE